VWQRPILAGMDRCWSCRTELPADARFCPSCGAQTRAAAGAGEERKVVSVLFADLVGWTSRSERLDPEDVRAALVPFHERVRSEIERHEGRVEKFIGDAVMALFGAPVAHGDDPTRSVLAALAIRDAVAELNETRGFDLHVRIGVATGEAIVDLGARPEEGEGMAAGDIVNTGFRLAESASVDGIVVDVATYGATQHAVEYRSAPPVEVKGKQRPLSVWEAIGRRTHPVEAQGPLLGRRDELQALMDAFADAPQLVTVVGVPGIGKSRLVSELATALKAGTSPWWLSGRSLSYGEETPFWALGEIVKAYAGIVRSDNPATTEAKLGEAVRAVVGDASGAEWVESHLRPLVGLSGAERTHGDSRHEAFIAWRRFFEALAGRRPVVLVFEDIHWADEGLLEFIDHMAASVGDVPLLIVCTARPSIFERHPGWGAGQPSSKLIMLGPLSDEDTAELVVARLDSMRLPEEVETAVLARAQGNPLYAEEYARMLVDRGFVGPEGRKLGRNLPLPESVHGIIAARLDGLPAEEKGLLQDAAVFGRVFSFGAVATMSGLPRYVLDERLARLERKQFVRREEVPAAPTTSMYGFHHVLVRDVAYAQIPRARRADKHRQAAVWIESLKSERQDLAEMVAHHYQSALRFAEAAGQDTSELARRTRDALLEAGERALALNGFDAAARFLKATLDLLPGDDEARPHVLFSYAKSLFHRGATGATDLVAARDGLLAAGDNEDAAEAEIMLAYLALWHRGDHDAAFAHLEAAQSLVADAPPSRAKAYVLGNAAHFLGLADQQERALVVAAAALALAVELRLDDAQAQALRTIGWLRAARGDAAGYADLEKSIEISLASNSPEFAVAYVNLAGSHIVFGDLRRAFDVLVEARQAAARLGRVHGTAWLLDISRVPEDYWCGRWDDAVERADMLVAERRVLAYFEFWIRIVRGQVRLARGDFDGALEDSAAALESARAAKDTQVLYPALAFRGRALAATGHGREAGEPIDELLSRLTGEEWSMAYFWADLAFALWDLGRIEDLGAAVQRVQRPTLWVGVADAMASGDLEGAADRCAEVGSLPDEAHVRLLAAKALADAGRPDDAGNELTRALAFHRGVGAEAYLREAEAVAAALAIDRV
jgi:class 3 adenylate cyclase/tetratricopeptide (TPR) repeat protein